MLPEGHSLLEAVSQRFACLPACQRLPVVSCKQFANFLRCTVNFWGAGCDSELPVSRGCDTGNIGAPLTHEQIEKFPNLKFKPTQKFRNLVSAVDRNDSAAAEISAEEALDLATGRVDPSTVTTSSPMGVPRAEKLRPKVKKTLKRLPGTDIPILPAPIQMPRLDLEALRRGEVPIRGAATGRERQLVDMYADVLMRRYPGTARTRTVSRTITGGQQGGSRGGGGGKMVWPSAAGGALSEREGRLGGAEIMVLESAGGQGFAHPGEFGCRQDEEEVLTLGLGSRRRTDVEHPRGGDVFSVGAGKDVSSFLEGMMEGRSMSSTDTVRYLFRFVRKLRHARPFSLARLAHVEICNANVPGLLQDFCFRRSARVRGSDALILSQRTVGRPRRVDRARGGHRQQQASSDGSLLPVQAPRCGSPPQGGLARAGQLFGPCAWEQGGGR